MNLLLEIQDNMIGKEPILFNVLTIAPRPMCRICRNFIDSIVAFSLLSVLRATLIRAGMALSKTKSSQESGPVPGSLPPAPSLAKAKISLRIYCSVT